MQCVYFLQFIIKFKVLAYNICIFAFVLMFICFQCGLYHKINGQNRPLIKPKRRLVSINTFLLTFVLIIILIIYVKA